MWQYIVAGVAAAHAVFSVSLDFLDHGGLCLYEINFCLCFQSLPFSGRVSWRTGQAGRPPHELHPALSAL